MEDGSDLTRDWLWLDFNGDRRLGLDDASGWIFHALFLPGDFAIDVLITVPAIASFLGLGSDSYGGVASKTVSVMFWIAVLIIAGTLWHALRDLDRALTAFVLRRWQGFVRGLRIARRKLASRIGMHLQRRRARAREMAVSELELKKLEAEVLSCYASLGEERTLGATDVSRMLRVSMRNAHAALLTLVRYRLLQPVFDNGDSLPAYQITRAGQIYLLER